MKKKERKKRDRERNRRWNRLYLQTDRRWVSGSLSIIRIFPLGKFW